MAKFEGMTPIEVTSKIIGDEYERKMRQVTIEQNEYYKSIRVFERPIGTYERDMWEIFKNSVEYKKYILEA